MITWIIYILVAFILFYILYLAIQGVNIGVEAKKEFLPMQPGDVIETYADISRTKKDFGYSPKTNVEVGIKNFIHWYRNYAS